MQLHYIVYFGTCLKNRDRYPQPPMTPLQSQLTDEELKSLDTFLADPVREDTTMDVATLEGFLVALAIGPETVLPSQWLTWV